MTSLVERLLAPLRRRLLFMVRRGVVKLVNDALGLQGLQVSLRAAELRGGIERFQEYGFSSVPLPGAEAILVAVGAQPGFLVAIAVDDKSSRPKGGLPGEVTLYSKFGQHVLLKADGSVEISAPNGVRIQGAPILAAKGVVQGDCMCAFTGAPHPQTSLTVKATP
jgi:phage baseplate assembly protein V